MKDLIDRQAAIRRYCGEHCGCEPQDCGLTMLQDGSGDCDFVRFLKEEPSAEPERKWIPCSERLPEDDTEVIVSCTDDSGDSEFSYTTAGWHFKGVWVVGNEISYFVRAWMPLPESYRGDEHENNR